MRARRGVVAASGVVVATALAGGVVAAPVAAAPAAAGCRPSITVLPLPAGATSGAIAAGVPGLAVGTVVTGYSSVAMRWAFAGGRWRMRPIPGLAGVESHATGVDVQGDVSLTLGPLVANTIVPAEPPTGAVFADGVVHVLPDGAGGTAAFTTGINDSGQVVGAAEVMVPGERPHPMQAAVRWDDWTQPPVVLQANMAYPSTASGIDDAGDVAGTDGSGWTYGFYARRWGVDGSLQPLTVGSSMDQPTLAHDVNESGRTVGTGLLGPAGTYRFSALVWDGATPRALPSIGPDDIGADAVSVSPSGVVVGTVDRFGVSGIRLHRVLFWTSGRVRSLLPASGRWTDPAQASAVDSVGTVYGSSAAVTDGPQLPTVWTCAARQAFVPTVAGSPAAAL